TIEWRLGRWRSAYARLRREPSSCGNVSECRLWLRKKKKKRGIVRRDLVLFGDASVTADVLKVLEKGPKFATEAVVKPQELFSMVRNVAFKAEEVERDRCILEGVEAWPGVSSAHNNRS
ncbi:hypothetical protein HPB47_023931, partial [Ixodes persulcatus]